MLCLFILRRKYGKRRNPRKVYAISDEEEEGEEARQLKKEQQGSSNLNLSQLIFTSRKSEEDEKNELSVRFDEGMNEKV